MKRINFATLSAVLLAVYISPSLANEEHKCLSNLLQIEMQLTTPIDYKETEITINCMDECSTPFAKGEINKTTNDIILPLKNNLSHGLLYLTKEGDSKFVNLETFNMKNNQSRYQTVKVGNRSHCVKYIKRENKEISKSDSSVGNFINDVAASISSKVAYYDVEFSKKEKCQNSKPISGSDLISDNTSDLINWSVRNSINNHKILIDSSYLNKRNFDSEKNYAIFEESKKILRRCLQAKQLNKKTRDQIYQTFAEYNKVKSSLENQKTKIKSTSKQ